ncbi:MAG: hypothetical protein ACREON_15380 [Gemmatimonadaceae bacterium]
MIKRWAAGAYLLLYLVTVGLVPIADARAEAAAASAPAVHVEAPGDTPCTPVHDHLACLLCRSVRTASPLHPLHFVPQAARLLQRPAPGVPSARPTETPPAPLGSRAPPLS